MRYKATYRQPHRLYSAGYTFQGFVEGKATRCELGHLTYDFTTYAGSHFGAVPAEDVQILGVLGGDEARLMADKISRLKSEDCTHDWYDHPKQEGLYLCAHCGGTQS